MMYDLVVKGGHVVDRTLALNGDARDIAVNGGRIAAVETEIDRRKARRVIEASGFLVTPGLIDLHVHVFDGIGAYSVDADTHCLQHGVTTAIDTGSAGAATYAGFRKYVIDRVGTRIYALLHIASQGLVGTGGELFDLSAADVDRTVSVVEENRDRILGIKIRLGVRQVGEHGSEALSCALQAAERTNLPLMVHVSELAIPAGELLARLRPGDIVTHCFDGRSSFVLDGNGCVPPFVRDAVDNGICFDVGHGRGSFSFDVAERALADGFVPTTISSDIHSFNVHGPVYDQPTTLAKFLALGMPLGEVIARSTVACVETLGLPSDLGSLQVGKVADIAILDLVEGNVTFTDSMNQTRNANRTLKAVSTIKDGIVMCDHRGPWASC